MIKIFETFTSGDLDKYEKSDLDETLSMYSGWYEFVDKGVEEIRDIVKYSIQEFKNKIPIFDKIHVQIVKDIDKESALGLYVNESALRIPIIFLGLKEIYKGIKEYDVSLDTTIRSTLFHELGHAIVDLDNRLVFKGKEEENILQFEDEEEYVEDFAFDFEMFGKVPNEILEFSK